MILDIASQTSLMKQKFEKFEKLYEIKVRRGIFYQNDWRGQYDGQYACQRTRRAGSTIVMRCLLAAHRIDYKGRLVCIILTIEPRLSVISLPHVARGVGVQPEGHRFEGLTPHPEG